MITLNQRLNPRIVVVNDESFILRTTEIMLRACLAYAMVLSLENSRTAWYILSRGDPDLLITDDKMPGMPGEEICRRLLTKKAAYPIIVNSDWPLTEQWVRECASQGLNIQFLPAPFNLANFRKVLEVGLKISRDKEP